MALSLALAGSAFVATAASAQIMNQDGELLLDFRATSGQGATTNFEVDLGAANLAQYQSGTVDLTNVLTATETSELNTLYGSNANVEWSVGGGNIGTLPAPYTNGSTFFITQSTTPGTLASNIVASGQSAESNVISGANGATATTISPGSITIAATDSNSYTSQLTATAGQYFSTPINNPETAYVPNGGATLTLYALQPDGGVDSGNATDYKLANFTFAAVPEPSTYVLMIGGLLTLVAFKRRWLNRSV